MVSVLIVLPSVTNTVYCQVACRRVRRIDCRTHGNER